jgi:hypothetical protein
MNLLDRRCIAVKSAGGISCHCPLDTPIVLILPVRIYLPQEFEGKLVADRYPFWCLVQVR